MDEMQTTDLPPLMRALPTLAKVGIGRTKAYDLMNSGKLPAVKVGNSTFIKRSDWDRFIGNLPSYPVTKGEANVMEAV